MAFAFHVEFGINDTPLTRAMEQGNYASAERLIIDCPNSSYLDDGCYQRTPLYICLCGVDQFSQRVTTRNLYLARLLVQHGASINKRVPVTNFGAEYISPGKSSLELLVDFFIDLVQEPPIQCTKGLQWHSWNPATELVVGLNKQHLTRREDVIQDVLDLIFDFLRHGGDPNIQDEHRRSLLHRAALRCPNASLLRLLHMNGGSLSQLDAAGNSPLLSVSSVDADSDEDEEDNDEEEERQNSWESSLTSWRDGSNSCAKSFEEAAESLCRSRLRIHKEPLLYLIKAKETDINQQNHLGRTALFNAVVREDMASARLLLEAGACPSIQASVWKSRRKKRKLSSLFASLMSLPLQQPLRHASLFSRMVSPVQPIAALVDAGYFSTEEVARELSDLIVSDFSELSHLCRTADSLIHLMFGYKTASLKQLAARKVFQYCLLETTACLHAILPVSAILENYPSTSRMPPAQSAWADQPPTSTTSCLPTSTQEPSDLSSIPQTPPQQESPQTTSTSRNSLASQHQTQRPPSQQLVSSAPKPHQLPSPSSSLSRSLPALLRSSPGKLEEYLTLVLNSTVLRRLLQLLQLPTSLQPAVEVHLLFLRMMLKVSALTARRPPSSPAVLAIGSSENAVASIGVRGGEIARFVPGGGIFRLGEEDSDEDENTSSDDSFDSSLDGNVEGDSDLEYW